MKKLLGSYKITLATLLLIAVIVFVANFSMFGFKWDGGASL
jgi:hypothetical protein